MRAARRRADQFLRAQHGAAVNFKVAVGLLLDGAAPVFLAAQAVFLDAAAQGANPAAEVAVDGQAPSVSRMPSRMPAPTPTFSNKNPPSSAPIAPPPTPKVIGLFQKIAIAERGGDVIAVLVEYSWQRTDAPSQTAKASSAD